MIFAGSGCTGAIDKLVGILNLRLPADLNWFGTQTAHCEVAHLLQRAT